MIELALPGSFESSSLIPGLESFLLSHGGLERDVAVSRCARLK